MSVQRARPVRAIVTMAVALCLALPGLVLWTPAAPMATAGTAADYPESPYAVTDYTEAFRGQFHFSPQNGFMNDINAPLYYRGVYRSFIPSEPAVS